MLWNNELACQIMLVSVAGSKPSAPCTEGDDEKNSLRSLASNSSADTPFSAARMSLVCQRSTSRLLTSKSSDRSSEMGFHRTRTSSIDRSLSLISPATTGIKHSSVNSKGALFAVTWSKFCCCTLSLNRTSSSSLRFLRFRSFSYLRMSSLDLWMSSSSFGRMVSQPYKEGSIRVSSYSIEDTNNFFCSNLMIRTLIG